MHENPIQNSQDLGPQRETSSAKKRKAPVKNSDSLQRKKQKNQKSAVVEQQQFVSIDASVIPAVSPSEDGVVLQWDKPFYLWSSEEKEIKRKLDIAIRNGKLKNEMPDLGDCSDKQQAFGKGYWESKFQVIREKDQKAKKIMATMKTWADRKQFNKVKNIKFKNKDISENYKKKIEMYQVKLLKRIIIKKGYKKENIKWCKENLAWLERKEAEFKYSGVEENKKTEKDAFKEACSQGQLQAVQEFIKKVDFEKNEIDYISLVLRSEVSETDMRAIIACLFDRFYPLDYVPLNVISMCFVMNKFNLLNDFVKYFKIQGELGKEKLCQAINYKDRELGSPVEIIGRRKKNKLEEAVTWMGRTLYQLGELSFNHEDFIRDALKIEQSDTEYRVVKNSLDQFLCEAQQGTFFKPTISKNAVRRDLDDHSNPKIPSSLMASGLSITKI